jgi:hypothetical protein
MVNSSSFRPLTQTFLVEFYNGPLSKPSKSEFWEGDTEHRSGVYLDVREFRTRFDAEKTNVEALVVICYRTIFFFSAHHVAQCSLPSTHSQRSWKLGF